MAPNIIYQVLSNLVFLSTVLNFPATTTSQECPYPCYPSPTGTGDYPLTPPASTSLPPPSQIESYPPPTFYPPPTEYLPFSPPYFGYSSPPPPEPVLPWFPFYYKMPPHQPDQSSSTAFRGSTAGIAVTHFLVFLLFFWDFGID